MKANEKNINAILDTNSHLLLNALARHFKVVYGIEYFKFDNDFKSDGAGNFSIWFEFKKFNSDKIQHSYIAMKGGNIKIGLICPNCGNEALAGYNASNEFLYCTKCETKITNHTVEDLITL